MRRKVRIFFGVDVHGSTHLWTKWTKTPQYYDADVIMLCGDLTGKAIVPIIEQKDGSFYSHYFDKDWELKGESEIRKMEDRISSSGAYPIRCNGEEVEELGRNPVKVHELMNEVMEKRLEEWLDLLEERVDIRKTITVVMPGNDDRFVVDSIIKSHDVIYPLGKVVDINGFEMISMDYVNPTPWDTPREVSEKKLKEKIEKLVDKLSNPEKAIFNFHAPPYDTDLDKAPKLDEDLKIVSSGGQPEVEHVGSKAIREIEEKYQPMLGLHGHIHESHGETKIGKTLILNPGSEYYKGILRGFIIEMSERGIESYWKVEG